MIAERRVVAEEKERFMQEKIVSIGEFITVGELADMLNLPVTTLIGELFKNGIAATINQKIDP